MNLIVKKSIKTETVAIRYESTTRSFIFSGFLLSVNTGKCLRTEKKTRAKLLLVNWKSISNYVWVILSLFMDNFYPSPHCHVVSLHSLLQYSVKVYATVIRNDIHLHCCWIAMNWVWRKCLLQFDWFVWENFTIIHQQFNSCIFHASNLFWRSFGKFSIFRFFFHSSFEQECRYVICGTEKKIDKMNVGTGIHDW